MNKYNNNNNNHNRFETLLRACTVFHRLRRPRYFLWVFDILFLVRESTKTNRLFVRFYQRRISKKNKSTKMKGTYFTVAVYRVIFFESGFVCLYYF